MTVTPSLSRQFISSILFCVVLAPLRRHPLIDQQIFVIGGAQVYQCLMPLMTDLVITHIKDSYEGDTFFPEYESQFPKSELMWEQPDFVIKRHFR